MIEELNCFRLASGWTKIDLSPCMREQNNWGELTVPSVRKTRNRNDQRNLSSCKLVYYDLYQLYIIVSCFRCRIHGEMQTKMVFKPSECSSLFHLKNCRIAFPTFGIWIPNRSTSDFFFPLKRTSHETSRPATHCGFVWFFTNPRNIKQLHSLHDLHPSQKSVK